jgi:hypothetical protein
MPLIPRTIAPPPPKARPATILSVGRRVWVHCRGHVVLTDEDGRASGHTLADGAEVEIVAWRPRGTATRYRVQARKDGREGWLAADALRQTAARVAPDAPTAAPAPARPVVRDGYRKFGQR